MAAILGAAMRVAAMATADPLFKRDVRQYSEEQMQKGLNTMLTQARFVADPKKRWSAEVVAAHWDAPTMARQVGRARPLYLPSHSSARLPARPTTTTSGARLAALPVSTTRARRHRRFPCCGLRVRSARLCVHRRSCARSGRRCRI